MHKLASMAAFALFFCASCTSAFKIPDMKPYRVETRSQEACEQIFVSDAIQMTHRLLIRMPDGLELESLGVVSIDPLGDQLCVALLSLEGIVYFDACKTSDRVVVRQAAEAAGSDMLAKGILNDLHMLFSLPKGTLRHAGKNDKMQHQCLWQTKTIQIWVLQTDNDAWQLGLVRESGCVSKTIEINMERNTPVIADFTLRNREIGYSIQGWLIESSPWSGDLGAGP